jgi:hypothetical protein
MARARSRVTTSAAAVALVAALGTSCGGGGSAAGAAGGRARPAPAAAAEQPVTVPSEPAAAGASVAAIDASTTTPTTTTADPWAVAATATPYAPTPTVLVAPEPIRLVAATIELDVPLIALGLAGDGTMEVPADAADAGWFTGGPRPGETGPAVIAGHVDSRTGPAVFARLGELGPGDEVAVVRVDGSHAVFTVTERREVPKSEFPTADVFGPTAEQSLRLVTCGGDFDRSTGHYRSNVVVFAELTRLA